MTSLNKISDKLIELNNNYARLYPEFYLKELNYVSVKAKLMREQYGLFSSQPTRDAAVQELLEQTQEYEEYHKLYPEIELITMQIKIYMQLSRNLTSIGWNEVK